MRYYEIRPEVAGGLAKGSVLDRSTHPPIVHKLHYEFDGWLGDALLESFPCFVVTDHLAKALERSDLRGIRFSPVATSTSEEFQEIYPGRQLPDFRWMQVRGRAGEDDFGIASDLVLVVSERALELLRRFGIEHAAIEDFRV
jgi:hypothetical protein